VNRAPKSPRLETMMEVIHTHCAGLDVHKQTVVACVRIAQASAAPLQEVRTFETTTSQLLQLGDWLESFGVRQVAMEATGVYWKPVWHVLEEHFELVLANAGHVKNVPGRKTDVNDSMWLADLLAHGLIRPSFVPPAPVQELRTLMRTRKQLVRERVAHVQRIEKTLEDANLKLAVVLSDLVGKSGRAVLQALINGQTQAEELIKHINYRVKASREQQLEALRGKVTAHHRFMLKLHLGQIDALDQAIGAIEKEVGHGLEPFRQAAQLISTMPGISEVSANAIISEIGLDMSRFETAGHLRSWACMCPRNDESAGKRRSNRTRRGGNWLKTTLVQCAWAAVRVKGSYPQALFHRIRGRRGAKKAILAVAASMLTTIWYMLRDGTLYQDLGTAHFEHADTGKTAKRLIRRLQHMGYVVSPCPA
jgi:transposase